MTTDITGLESAMRSMWDEAGRRAADPSTPSTWDAGFEEAMAAAANRATPYDGARRSHGGSA